MDMELGAVLVAPSRVCYNWPKAVQVVFPGAELNSAMGHTLDPYYVCC